MSEGNPCLSCGACCAHFRIMLHGDEVEPVGHVPRALVNPVGAAFCMKGTDVYPPLCIALEGEMGQAVRCTIYDQRPLVCREFNEYELDGAANPSCFKLRGLVPPQR
jgi:Fe-S-cluster containining protein